MYAVLVESGRVNGKPRQKFVRRLASIQERYLMATAHREYFWERVDWRLKDLKLDADQRGRVIAALENKVARPSEAEVIQLRREREAFSSRTDN